MKFVKILMLFIVSINYSFGQKDLKPCKDTIHINEYSDNSVGEDLIMTDSLRKETRIIFEQDFDEKVTVFVNDKIFFSEDIKTQRNLGLCLKMADIDYSKFLQLPRISIVLSKSNHCVSFYPKPGKRIAYVNCIQGAWLIELSNVIREYR